MTENQLAEIARDADMIVGGYAFTRKNEMVRILNLRHPDHAMVITESGKLLETNMDEIEQVIVQNIWKKDAEYMEHTNA